jgi:hypothetical protein
MLALKGKQAGKNSILANKIVLLMERTLEDFLAGKSEHTLALYNKLISEFEGIGGIRVHAAKSMICIAGKRNFAYVIQLGKNFVDLVLPFKQTFPDNMCFRKIRAVPGSDDYNHHLRIQDLEDFNEEVIGYLKMAYRNASEGT